MPGHIASAFVQVRPDTTGFKAEAERGIKSGLSGVGKLIGGAFAAVGIEEGVRRVAEAAASQQEELSVVRQAIKTTDSAWIVHGKTVSETLRETAVKFGFTVADLAQGFTRIQVGTKDSAKTFSLLDQAMDVSRARHLGLAQSAIILTRAAQGNDVSLRRLGIVIDKVSTAQDALRRRHDEAVASGAKFTKQQELEYKNALAQAAALDKQATREKILSEIRERFGGQAANFARTAEGSGQRFHEAVNELEVAVGNGLLPTLTEAAAGATHLFKELADGGEVQAFAASTARELASAYRLFKGIAEALAPPIEAIARAVGDVAHEAGGGGIVAFAIGFKTLSLAIAADAAIRAKWAKVVAAGGGAAAEAATAERAESVALGELSLALEANTAALVGNTDARTGSAAATSLLIGSNTAAVASNEALAASSIAAGAAMDVEVASAGRLAVVGRGLFALAGGWSTVVAVGLGAAAFGIYKLITAEDELDRANKRVIASTQELDRVTQLSANLKARLADLTAQIPNDRIALAQAKLNEETAKNALLTSKAARGGEEFRQLQINLLQSIQARREAQRRLNEDEQSHSKVAADSASADRQTTRGHEERARSIEALARAEEAAAVRSAKAGVLRSRQSFDSPGGIAAVQKARADAAGRFADQLDKDAEKEKNKTLRRNDELIAALARRTGRRPSIQTIRLILDNKDPKAKLADLLKDIRQSDRTAALAAHAAGEHVGRSYGEGMADGIKTTRGLIAAAAAGAAQAAADASKRKLGIHSPSTVARDEIGVPIGQGIAVGITASSGTLEEALSASVARAVRGAGTRGIDLDGVLADQLDLRRLRARIREEIQGLVPDDVHAGGSLETRGGRPFVRRGPSEPDVRITSKTTAADLEPLVGRGVSRAGANAAAEWVSEHRKALAEVERLLALESATANGMRRNAKKVAAAFGEGIAEGIGEQARAVNEALGKLLGGALQASKESIGAHSPSERTRTEIGHAISDGISLGILDRNGSVVSAITSQVDDAIGQGVQAVRDAVNSAKQNLNSIGGGLAGDIGTLLEKRGAAAPTQPTGPQAARLKELLRRVHSGQADDQTIRLAQALSDQAVARQSVGQQSGTNQAEAITRKLADLTDLLNRGSIGEKTFDKRLDSILKQAGATPEKAQRALGVAFADQLRADIRGLREQAKALLAGPRVAGTGLEPTIVKPLETIREQQRNIADAAANQRAQQLAEAKRQTSEQKRQTKHLADIAAHTKGTATIRDINRWIKNAEKNPKGAADALIAAANRHGR